MKFLKIKHFFLIYFIFLHHISNSYSKDIFIGADLFNFVYNFDRKYKYCGRFFYTLPFYPSFTFQPHTQRKYCHDLRIQFIYNKNDSPYAFGIILSSKKSEDTRAHIQNKINNKIETSHYSLFAHVIRYNFLMYNIYPYSTSHKTFYVCLGGNLSYCGEEKKSFDMTKNVFVDNKIIQQYKWYIWFNFSIISSYGFSIFSISTNITFDFLLFKIREKKYPEKDNNNPPSKKNNDDTINVYCFGAVNDDSFQFLYPMPKLSIVFNFINYTSDQEKQIIN